MKSIKNTKVTMTPYARVEKLEKELKQFLGKEKLSESKIKIKNILREGINPNQENVRQQIQAEMKRLNVDPNNAEVYINNEEIDLSMGEGLIDRIKDFKTALAKIIVGCSVIAGAVSCQKSNPHVYKFSYAIENLVEPETKPNPAGYEDAILTPYNPEGARGSWFELENHKLSPAEMEAEEDQLEATEKARLTGKNYTIKDCKLEYMGQSKRGDIQTTNGNVGG